MGTRVKNNSDLFRRCRAELSSFDPLPINLSIVIRFLQWGVHPMCSFVGPLTENSHLGGFERVGIRQNRDGVNTP